MGLETGTYISDLVATNPLDTDDLSLLDEHIRLIKTCIKNTFPFINAEVSISAGELNYLTGLASNYTTQILTKVGRQTVNAFGSVVLAPNSATSISITAFSAGEKAIFYDLRLNYASTGTQAFGPGFPIGYIEQYSPSISDILVLRNDNPLSTSTVGYTIKAWR